MYLCDKGSILVLPIEYIKNNKERMFIMNSKNKKNNKRKDVYYEFEKQKNL